MSEARRAGAACVLVTLARDPLDAAARGLLHLHLEAAATAPDPLLASALLCGVDGEAVAFVAARDRDTLAGLAACHGAAGLEHHLCGVDARAVGGDDSTAGYLDLVLDRTDPPVPFDDPVVARAQRDLHAWYLPMLGTRHLADATLWHDGVRAAGSWLAFTAPDDAHARWLAAANPWRRIAPGRLLRLPARLLAATPAPAGPGTQRTGRFVCGRPRSVPEPS